MATTDPGNVFVGVARWRKGTASGVFRRRWDGDAPWEHLTHGLPEAANVQAITVHPGDPAVVFAGTQDGPYRSTDGGRSWERTGFPDRGMQVWSILVHPERPRTVFAGTSPIALYRSDDGGDNWRRLPDPQVPERVKMQFACRVMRLAVDPQRPDELYAVQEVNGVMRSRDAGETWQDCSADLIKMADENPKLKSAIGTKDEREGMLDGHALTVSAADPGAVFVAVRMGLFRSPDRGESWADLEVGRFSPLRYGRDVRVSPHDPRVLYACLSEAAVSEAGALYRSTDVGRSWARFDKVAAHGTMMGVALHPRDPAQVFAAARYGQVFGTLDGGRTWSEHTLPEGCLDVYAIACA